MIVGALVLFGSGIAQALRKKPYRRGPFADNYRVQSAIGIIGGAVLFWIELARWQ